MENGRAKWRWRLAGRGRWNGSQVRGGACAKGRRRGLATDGDDSAGVEGRSAAEGLSWSDLDALRRRGVEAREMIGLTRAPFNGPGLHGHVLG